MRGRTMRGRGAGGIIGLVVVLAPYVLRFAGIVLIIAFAIWELGKLVTCAQQKLPSTNAETVERGPSRMTRRVFFGIIAI